MPISGYILSVYNVNLFQTFILCRLLQMQGHLSWVKFLILLKREKLYPSTLIRRWRYIPCIHWKVKWTFLWCLNVYAHLFLLMQLLKARTVLYCICRKPYDRRAMIACNQCDEWYHFDCINLHGPPPKTYICPACNPLHGDFISPPFLLRQEERYNMMLKFKFLKCSSIIISFRYHLWFGMGNIYEFSLVSSLKNFSLISSLILLMLVSFDLANWWLPLFWQTN